MTRLRSLLVALVLAAPLAACTQQVDPIDTIDPQTGEVTAAAESAKLLGQLTAVDAKFSRWLPTPSGKPFGMLLDDGSLVRVRPDAVTDTTVLNAGDAVHVESVKHDATFAFASVSKDGKVLVEAPKHQGKHFAHKGKHHGWKKHHKGEHAKGEHAKGEHHEGWKKGEHKGDKAAWAQKMKDKHAAELASLSDLSVSGKVSMVIPGRHGKGGAVLLDDGTVVWTHGEITAKQGDVITAAGKGGTYPIGKALFVETLAVK